MNQIAPIGKVYVCSACGKRSHDKYGTQQIDSGWDESCYMHSALYDENDLIFENGRVIAIKDNSILDNLFMEVPLIRNELENNVEHKMTEDNILDDYCLEMDLPIPSGEPRSLMLIMVRSIMSRRPEIQTGREFIDYCESFSNIEYDVTE